MIFKALTSARTNRAAYGDRLPPGQTLTDKWPVLHYGGIPRFDPFRWDFTITGLVEEPVTWSLEEFRALPKAEITADMHCVTRWSTFDNLWEGVSTKEVLSHVALKPEAKFVLLKCDGGYTTNMPLSVFADDDCLFAWRNNGEDISPAHGWPLRLVVPKKYAWKSAKWVRGIEFLPEDRLGFWERYGYHNDADPWKEERFA
jgi:DMSO/TMAO reductase YedYZ molybdopterin-dependent catalytic subunit